MTNSPLQSENGSIAIATGPLSRDLGPMPVAAEFSTHSGKLVSGRRVTMHDIARKLGIDRSTVSLSLRGHPRISQALRSKVQAAAKELGYQPDPMLSALAYYRHTTTPNPTAPGLAWVNRGASRETLRSSQKMNSLYQGAYETARENGYLLHDIWLDPEEPLSRGKKHFSKLNTKGLLIPSQFKELCWKGIAWEKFAVVGLGYFTSKLPVHSVVPDQMHAGVLGFQKAYEKGYRRIGLCTGRDAKDQGWRHAPGFRMAQLEVPESERVPVLYLDEIHPEQDRMLLLGWLKKYSVDAIFSTMPNTRFMLESSGYRVPEDVALAAADLADSDADAGVEQNEFEMGRLAVETLISHLNHNHRGIPKIACSHSIEPRWVDGACLPERH